MSTKTTTVNERTQPTEHENISIEGQGDFKMRSLFGCGWVC